jgi:hypothetical protein
MAPISFENPAFPERFMKMLTGTLMLQRGGWIVYGRL